MSWMTTSYDLAIRVNGIKGVTVFLANCITFFPVIPETDSGLLTLTGQGREPPFLFEVVKARFAKVTTLPFRCRAAEVRILASHLALGIVHKIDLS